MSRNKIYIYHKEKFSEFYNKFSGEYNIISLSSLLNISSNFEKNYLSDEKTFVDITAMLKLVSIRDDIIMFYEVIINHLYQQGNVDFIVEDNYVNKAFEIFPEYFFEKEYFTNLEVNKYEVDVNKCKESEIKRITVYNDDNFDEFVESKMNEEVNVFSITKIIKQLNGIGYSLDSSLLSDTQKYILDITLMVKMANLRSDLLMAFELILNELSKFSNIDFAINKDSKNTCKQLFRYNFEEYIEIDKIIDEKIQGKAKLIVDMTNQEIDGLLKKFDEQLFGHSNFKRDFNKQLKKYKILNKMKEIKIFSIFLCGDSGIGKTEVARILHRNLYPNSKEIKINFGNYSERGSLWSLIGSPKGYFGSEKGGELTNKILNSNSKIILIDEFDRADRSIFNFFYELLEDGKFTDLDENEIDLNGYIIIFTSNLKGNNYNDVIPKSLFSRFSMRYEFISLNDEERQAFVEYRVEQLITKYNNEFDNTFNNSQKAILLNTNIADLNNLRDINIRLTNKFIELVDL